MEYLETILSLIIGVKGVPLTYFIRKIEGANFDENLTYEEAIIQAIELTGHEFKINSRTFHQLILVNVPEYLDA